MERRAGDVGLRQLAPEPGVLDEPGRRDVVGVGVFPVGGEEQPGPDLAEDGGQRAAVGQGRLEAAVRQAEVLAARGCRAPRSPRRSPPPAARATPAASARRWSGRGCRPSSPAGSGGRSSRPCPARRRRDAGRPPGRPIGSRPRPGGGPSRSAWSKVALRASTLGADACLYGTGQLALSWPRAIPEERLPMVYRHSLVFAAACLGMLLFGVTLTTLGSVLAPADEPPRTGPGQRRVAAVADEPGHPGGLAGLRADRRSPRLSRRAGRRAAWACCSAWRRIALAPSGGFLALAVFVFGFSGGIINGSTNALVSDISEEGRGSGLSLLGVFFGLGALGVPLVLGLLLRRLDYAAILELIGLMVLIPVGDLPGHPLPAAQAAPGIPDPQGGQPARRPDSAPALAACSSSRAAWRSPSAAGAPSSPTRP